MKFLENYKDFIGKGMYNKVSELDSDWVIKTPLNMKELNYHSITDMDFKNQKMVLNHFKNHIKFMKDHPKYFPKVKMLDKYRAAIERLNTEKAKEEIEDVVDILNNNFNLKLNKRYFLEDTYRATKDSREILNFMKNYNDDIVKKWYDFLIDIKNNLPDSLDIHSSNVGLDKEGNIKLLDF